MSFEHRVFTDPEALTAAIPGRAGRYKVLGRGAFSAALTVAELGSVTLQCAHESLARVAYNTMPSGRVGILGWPRGGRLPVVRGVQMRAGDLLSIGDGTESYHRTPASVDYVALSVDSNELSRVAFDLVGRELRLENGLVCLTSNHGIALLALGLACWPKQPSVARGSAAVFGMLTYNAGIALYLVWLRTIDETGGVLLWPAVMLHAGMTLAIARAGLARYSDA